MILFSIGLPSRLAQWCDLALGHVARLALGSADRIALDGLAQLAAAVIGSDGSHLVVCCRRPAINLQAELIKSDRPYLIATSDPRAALGDLVLRGGYSLANATRAVASSCVAMLSLADSPRALVVAPDRAGDAAAIVAAIAAHFGLQLGRGDLVQLVAQLPHIETAADDADYRSWSDGLDPDEQAIVNGALEPYVAQFAGGDPRPIVWQPQLFYASEEPSPGPEPTPLRGYVDITGRVRFLIYGPFIDLPQGAWSADVLLGFSAEAAGMHFLIEVYAGAQLAHTWLECSGEQVVESRLNFTIGQSVDQPVQIRVCTQRAAFDGRIGLGYVTIARRPTVPAETREHLAQLLRR
jgi:hypothetical protein